MSVKKCEQRSSFKLLSDAGGTITSGGPPLQTSLQSAFESVAVEEEEEQEDEEQEEEEEEPPEAERER